MLQDEPVALGPNPPNLLSKQLEFLPPVIYDEHPIGKSFGEVVRHPMKSYKAVSSYSDLTLKAPITTAADDKFCDIFSNF